MIHNDGDKIQKKMILNFLLGALAFVNLISCL